MQKRLFRWEVIGFLFVSAVGTVLHFLYEWSGQSLFAAVISAVNESTWEHMKLLFVPMFLFSVAQGFAVGRTYPNFLAVRAISTLTGLALIPILFYIYSGIWGSSAAWINIAIFYFSVLAAFALDFRLLRRGRFSSPWQQLLGLMVLWALAFLFVWCTFRPPGWGLWQAPVTGGCGI